MSNRIQGTTGLIGLIGDPLKHSRSPHMHNSAFDKLGLDYVYLCFEVPKGELKNGIEALKTFSAKGSNITFPHKQEVLKYLALYPEAFRFKALTAIFIINKNELPLNDPLIQNILLFDKKVLEKISVSAITTMEKKNINNIDNNTYDSSEINMIISYDKPKFLRRI